MAHTHPAPTVIASGTDNGSGTSVALDLPGGSYVPNDQFHAIILMHQAGATTTNPTTTATGWTRRDRHSSEGGAGVLVLDYWTHTIAGGETTMTVNTSVTATMVAVFFVIDSHSGISSPFFSSPQLNQFGSPQTVSSDFRYHVGGTISPHEAVRFLAVDILAGADDDGGGLTDPTAPPPGYTMVGVRAGDDHLYVAYKSTTSPDQEEDPGYAAIGVGGWLFQTPGNGWTWDEVGEPENNDGGSPSPPEFAHLLQDVDMMNTWHYHEYVPDEEDFPHWGILGAMA